MCVQKLHTDMKQWTLVFCWSLLAGGLFAQEQDTLWKRHFTAEELAIFDQKEDTLGLMAYFVINDSLPENRFAACHKLIPTLVSTLKTPNSFKYPFERLKSVSIMYPPDSSFRIFTWQLYVDKDEYRYYGAIQMNTKELKLFPLKDRSFEIQGNLEQLELTPEQWFGVVYYNIQQTDTKNGRYYLLFGFDGHEFFRKRKVLDVLTFKEGLPVFGAPVFRHESGKGEVSFRKRRVIEYASAASIRLNYDPALGIIIYDHLISMPGEDGEGLNNYPDGSYEGYKLEKTGLWHYVENVFTQTQDEAPRPFPVLDTRKKDILGRND
jgi:hypothetical protein